MFHAGWACAGSWWESSSGPSLARVCPLSLVVLHWCQGRSQPAVCSVIGSSGELRLSLLLAVSDSSCGLFSDPEFLSSACVVYTYL